MMGGTIVFDLTSAARWSGPPVGIVRAQRELARWARDHLPNLVFAAFDPTTMDYRALSARHADAFIAGTASLNTWASPDPTGRRRRRSAWLPSWLYSALQARRTVLRLLERFRLADRRPRLSRVADRLQRALITPRHRGFMINDDGSRRDFLPPDMVFGQALRLEADDTLICAGFGWSHSNITAIAQAKARERPPRRRQTEQLLNDDNGPRRQEWSRRALDAERGPPKQFLVRPRTREYETREPADHQAQRSASAQPATAAGCHQHRDG